MKQIFYFFYGNHPLLSLAELSAFFEDKEFVRKSDNFFEIKTDKNEEEIKEIMKSIGGIIKVAKKEGENIKEHEYAEGISQLLIKKFSNTEGKIRFGLSTYGKNLSKKKLLIKVKKDMKSAGKSVRFINQGEGNVPGILLEKEKLLTEKGMELNLIAENNSWIPAKTIAAQDIENYSKRDYDKPGRDAKSGMLPPKLAQIMLNIAQAKSDGKIETIWDPFCGSGVILLEALLTDLTAIGSDISKKAVFDSEENVIWLYEHYGFKKHAEVFLQDATRPWKKEPTFNAIVAETYLGPPLRNQLHKEEIIDIMNELESLYIHFFRNLKKLMDHKKVVVMAFPCFRYRDSMLFFEELGEKLEALGYKQVELIPKTLGKKLHLEEQERKSLVYSRKDQWVGREICVFRYL